jgi:CheY-like chemotaxis protein
MGKRSVLVVDDEPLVLGIVERMVRDAGHTVFACVGGPAAIDFIANHTAVISVLVTDVRMPNVDGAQVVAAARARWPFVRVVYMSGYCGTPEETAGFADADCFLPKPFTRARLLEAVLPWRGCGAEGIAERSA